eukprot:TRINITY_DN16866_c0_g1_i13.p1 TRINITY_DN16866_c0_g1~~TRINITY_DN16866_c0_g1_i13.p1  ORF type:complete len:294 (+),score=41.24 TRINITY_DN16866_c0_g1_i13:168-1049(+)
MSQTERLTFSRQERQEAIEKVRLMGVSWEDSQAKDGFSPRFGASSSLLPDTTGQDAVIVPEPPDLAPNENCRQSTNSKQPSSIAPTVAKASPSPPPLSLPASMAQAVLLQPTSGALQPGLRPNVNVFADSLSSTSKVDLYQPTSPVGDGKAPGRPFPGMCDDDPWARSTPNPKQPPASNGCGQVSTGRAEVAEGGRQASPPVDEWTRLPSVGTWLQRLGGDSQGAAGPSTACAGSGVHGSECTPASPQHVAPGSLAVAQPTAKRRAPQTASRRISIASCFAGCRVAQICGRGT